MNVQKIKAFLLFLFMSVGFQVSALDVVENISVTDVSEDSIDLTWDPVEGADVYEVSYDQADIFDISIPFDSELFETNKGVIENLNKNTEYSFAIRAFSSETGEESDDFSSVITQSTSGDALELLVLEDGVTVKDALNISVEFTKSIDPNADIEITLRSLLDNSSVGGEIIAIVSLEDPRVVELELTDPLQELSSYELLIQNITDIDGKNISSGVNQVVEFTVDKFPEEEVIAEEIVDEEITPEETIEENLEPGIELNAAMPEEEIGAEEEITPVVVSIDTSEEVKELPDTGTKEVFIILLALVFGLGFMFLRREQI